MSERCLKSTPNIQPVFMSIPEAAKHTGLAVCFIRKGVKEGRIPAIINGKKYLVNVPLMLERLNAECETRKG